MELHIESTTDVAQVDGNLCRVWQGTSPRGTCCAVFVAGLLVEETGDPETQAEFEAELISRPVEVQDVRSYATASELYDQLKVLTDILAPEMERVGLSAEACFALGQSIGLLSRGIGP